MRTPPRSLSLTASLLQYTGFFKTLDTDLDGVVTFDLFKVGSSLGQFGESTRAVECSTLLGLEPVASEPDLKAREGWGGVSGSWEGSREGEPGPWRPLQEPAAWPPRGRRGRKACPHSCREGPSLTCLQRD